MSRDVPASSYDPHPLVSDYVAGRLSDADAAALEDYCVAHPEFVREVEGEEHLREVLRAAGAGSFVGRRASASGRWWRPAALIAASIAATGLAIGWFALQRLATTPLLLAASVNQLGNVADSGGLERIILNRVRSSGPSTVLVARSAEVVAIEVSGTEFAPGTQCTLELRRFNEEGGLDAVARGTAHVGTQGSVTVYARRELFGDGGYRLRISAQESQSDESFDFAVRAE